jgi:hypothetical protein
VARGDDEAEEEEAEEDEEAGVDIPVEYSV